MKSLAEHIMECAEAERLYIGCAPFFGDGGIAGPEVMVGFAARSAGRTPGRPACHGGAPRCRLEQAGPSRIGARQGCYAPPGAHELRRARRGAIPSEVVSA